MLALALSLSRSRRVFSTICSLVMNGGVGCEGVTVSDDTPKFAESQYMRKGKY